jgi:hypothetical protein
VPRNGVGDCAETPNRQGFVEQVLIGKAVAYGILWLVTVKRLQPK